MLQAIGRTALRSRASATDSGVVSGWGRCTQKLPMWLISTSRKPMSANWDSAVSSPYAEKPRVVAALIFIVGHNDGYARIMRMEDRC